MSAANSWSLNSNNGWSTITFEHLVDQEPLGCVEYSITARGKFWYRPAMYGDTHQYELTDDFSIALPSVLLNQTSCSALVADFDLWLSQRVGFSRSLSAFRHQSILLDLDKEYDHGEADHPGLRFRYDAGRCKIELRFVVDPACVQLARDALTLVLSNNA